MKTVLASLTGLPGDHAALKTAALVAKAHDAHLDALHVHMGLRTVQAMTANMASMTQERLADTSSRLARQENERRARAHAAFVEVTLRHGLPTAAAPLPGVAGPTAGFVDVDSLALEETARRARFYDLVVMAREHQLAQFRIPTVLMESGRPVLIAPPHPRDTVGTSIAIAWKPSAQAARALTAASPFLAKTSKVTIFVAPEDGVTQPQAIAAAEPLQQALAWRGLQAQIVATGPAQDVGEALREAAYTHEADLLVMGGYGHSRLRETILGGVTRSLLASCDIPLLLAH